MRITGFKVLFGYGFMLVLLASCTQTPEKPIIPPNFDDLAPLSLSVGQVTTENLHNEGSEYPHVERLSPYPLVDIVEQWGGKIFIAAPNSNDSLVMQVLDASLIEEKLPRSGGLQGLFTNDQSEIYHGHILLKLSVSFPDFTGEMEIESRASQSVAENITLRERQQIWVDLGNKMVRDIDRQLRSTIAEKLPRLQLTR